MICVESHGAVRVVKPNGALNSESSDHLAEAIGSATSGGVPMLVIDLSAVALIDSVGLEALLDAGDQVGFRGGVVKLCRPRPLVADILQATGVADRFEVFSDIKRALGSFSR